MFKKMIRHLVPKKILHKFLVANLKVKINIFYITTMFVSILMRISVKLTSHVGSN
jgi:hypothetical protein